MNSEKKMLIAKALALRSQINILLIDNSSRELLECLTTQHHALANKMTELKKQQLIVLDLIKDLGTPINSCWTKQRENQFWEHDCQRNGSAFFKENFRMDRYSFDDAPPEPSDSINKRRNHFQSLILKKLEKIEKQLEKSSQESIESSKEILDLTKKMVENDNKKTEMMEEYMKDCKETYKRLLEFLNK